MQRAGPLPYLLRIPDETDAAPHPVLVFLHGYDEGAPTSLRDGLTRHGPLRPGALDRSRGFIVVAPHLPVRGDLWRRHADDVSQIVAAVQDEYRGDRTRTYLTGFSFGGNGVFDLALALPGLWAALWAVDPTRVPADDPNLPVWLSVGEVARRATRGFVRALKLRDAEDGLDGDRLYLDENADHVGAATRAYQDARIYGWLISKVRLKPDTT